MNKYADTKEINITKIIHIAIIIIIIKVFHHLFDLVLFSDCLLFVSFSC